MPTELRSHNSGGTVLGSNVNMGGMSAVTKLMSSCPHLDINIGRVDVACLMDTGSMVSTLTVILWNILNLGARTDYSPAIGYNSGPLMGWLSRA